MIEFLSPGTSVIEWVASPYTPSHPATKCEAFKTLATMLLVALKSFRSTGKRYLVALRIEQVDGDLQSAEMMLCIPSEFQGWAKSTLRSVNATPDELGQALLELAPEVGEDSFAIGVELSKNSPENDIAIVDLTLPGP